MHLFSWPPFSLLIFCLWSFFLSFLSSFRSWATNMLSLFVVVRTICCHRNPSYLVSKIIYFNFTDRRTSEKQNKMNNNKKNFCLKHFKAKITFPRCRKVFWLSGWWSQCHLVNNSCAETIMMYCLYLIVETTCYTKENSFNSRPFGRDVTNLIIYFMDT